MSDASDLEPVQLCPSFPIPHRTSTPPLFAKGKDHTWCAAWLVWRTDLL